MEAAARQGSSAALAEPLTSAATVTTEKTSSPATNESRRFRRRSRLTDSSAYSRVFKKAERSRDMMFTVLYKKNEEHEARLGLAISKKHCRSAVGRNRLKRLVRESFRLNRAELQGLDVVVINQPPATRASNKALFDSLQKHWQRCRSLQAVDTGEAG